MVMGDSLYVPLSRDFVPLLVGYSGIPSPYISWPDTRTSLFRRIDLLRDRFGPPRLRNSFQT